MSGIVGIFHRDGAPVERHLLQVLAQFLSKRGPDAREIWSADLVGFGHTMLRTTPVSASERQPANLGSELWITADVRLDCRAELEAKLDRAEHMPRQAAPDSELILHAYAAWGERCTERLRGDFSFAIWDARRKTLFCARDHFGVKPFYYASLGSLFLFSNTLDCVRSHPDVSDTLNDAAIADFLLFGFNSGLATTTFSDIQRLPPAHFLTVSAEEIRIERYWSAPTDGHIRYRRTEDYVEHMNSVLKAAVSDRMGAGHTGIWLSGGMDSSSIAAVACELSAKSGEIDLRGFTMTCDSLFPDEEGAHAREVADFLEIPLQYLPMGGLQLFERWSDPEHIPSEPVEDPFFAGLFDQYRVVSADCRVMLSGEGNDSLMLFEMWPYTRELLRNREWRRFFADVPNYLWLRPFPWRGIRQRVRRAVKRDPNAPVFPPWIAPDLVRRANLESRWREGSAFPPGPRHPIVPKAHASLSVPQWSRVFELADPGVTHHPVEVRYPFLDLRVVNYVLALPPFPWAFQKRLLREAMAGRLPESILQRPKTPLAGDPLVEMLRRPEATWVDQVQWDEEIDRYIDRSALPRLSQESDSERASVSIRPLCLNFWLQFRRGIRYNLMAEARNG